MTIKHFCVDYVRYLYYLLFNQKHKSNMRRFRACPSKKSKALMKLELQELRRFWGCLPMQYYTQDLYRDDCGLLLDEMKSYIPGYYFYYIIYPTYDDVKLAKRALDNKILSYFTFKGMGFPTATLVAIKKDKHIFSPSGALLCEAAVSAINDIAVSKLFIKPVAGKGGVGILIAKKSDGTFKIKNVKFDLDYLKGLNGDYIVEAQVLQSDYLNEIYPHSVNTLRAVTQRNSDGVVSLIAVILRMGIDGSEVDNSHLGGLLIGVDLLTGKVVRDYASYEYGPERYYQHPDTGYDFSNLRISNWSEISATIIKNAEGMILHNLIGWDIALTDQGPIVIEANTMFGMDCLQSGVGGLRRHFFNDDMGGASE
jgi:hypothetical protein